MTETEALPPELEEPPGHALSTRGYILVALIPPLIAAVGIVLLWLHYNPDQLVEGKNVPLVLSPWHPGSPSNDTVITGTLELGSLGDERCVDLLTEGGSRVNPVFPAGYVASVTDDGRLNLYDTGRHLIANGGDVLRATGEVAPVGGYAGRPCAPPSGTDVAIIESPIVITQR